MGIASIDQMKLLFVLYRPIFGEKPEERLDWASGILGREVTTFAETLVAGSNEADQGHEWRSRKTNFSQEAV